jgi:putative membrane-bound dehydrogenase-like protein
MKLLSISLCALFAGPAVLNAATFPAPYNSETDTNAVFLSAAEAAASFQLPPGFAVSVFASEPEVQNPIGLAWDARGRLWIAENYTYAERAKRFDLGLKDRIVIFEDRDGNGRAEVRRVFTEDVQRLTSVEVGHGGVWAMCPPQLLFFPDRDRNDVPDGPAEVVLDGFTVPAENYHNVANGLRWGPDGWLYGRCGTSAPGRVAAPGTPEAQRVPPFGGLWRYHPKRKVFEPVWHGTMNPWGHDWDEMGEAFFINTVNGHLWHGIVGAHYKRAHSIDPNPRSYSEIDMHADHWHFDTGKTWTASRDGKANDYGGGHAHIGMMIYQGNNWPASYRGKLFTVNMHGRRVNVERLERSGSGYVGRHEPDMLLSGDAYYRGMELSCGPDGGVVMLDWIDAGECHEATGVHRTSGRIYKFTAGAVARVEARDLSKLSARDLARMQTHTNEWFARQTRLALAERAESGRDVAAARRELRQIFERNASVPHKLRALWTLNEIGGADAAWLRQLLRHENEHVRVWAIRLLTDSWPLDTVFGQKADLRFTIPDLRADLSEFIRMAAEDRSAMVRLTLASTLQRLPVGDRVALATPLVAHAEDASDHNLPLMIWYGLMPVAEANAQSLATLGAACKLPETLRCVTRRLAEDIEKHPAAINSLLAAMKDADDARAASVFTGMSEALAGWRKAAKPAAWDTLTTRFAGNAALSDRVRELSAVFGDGRALDEVRRLALDGKAGLETRRAALKSLIEARPDDLRAVCEQLLSVRFLNSTAARGLASFDDPAIGVKLARSYRSFHASERAAVIETLVSRPMFAHALLSEMAAGKFPREDLTPFHARQIRSFNDTELNAKLTSTWGELRESDEEKRAFIAKLKAQFTADSLSSADKGRGRVVFNQACAACHRLYGEGGQAGPDLTGAGRDNLDYLLENIADPSAVVTADFRMTVVNLKDGRVLNGLLAAKTDRTLTLRTMTETLTIERKEVESTQESKLSLMPEGLLESLTDAQRRDLIAYLMHPAQVSLPGRQGFSER